MTITKHLNLLLDVSMTCLVRCPLADCDKTTYWLHTMYAKSYIQCRDALNQVLQLQLELFMLWQYCRA